ncbi:hypothetical protein [Selenomonas sp.]|uniref:hypothetical protein n=1 Tax=Selenomonas sp. TaxID=2053611 RepID=UPI002A75022F|nr:hypothetical protein [Selenomonas sp.]
MRKILSVREKGNAVHTRKEKAAMTCEKYANHRRRTYAEVTFDILDVVRSRKETEHRLSERLLFLRA